MMVPLYLDNYSDCRDNMSLGLVQLANHDNCSNCIPLVPVMILTHSYTMCAGVFQYSYS